MRKKFYSLFLTSLLGLYGMNVGAQDLSTTFIDGKEYYQITSHDDLAAFSQIVNAGEFDANAVLTQDINLTDMIAMDGWIPIGDWGTQSGTASACYKGHFDGQGHKIEGFNGTSSQNYYGIFGVVSTGCLIENVSVYGTITTNIATAGVVGYARDATVTLRNIHSYLYIDNTRAGSRLGGILGSSMNGTIIVDRCTYSGILDGNDSGGSGNYGGIVGYVNNNTNAHLRVTNCLFDGRLWNSNETPGGCTFGGIVGYVGANPDVIIENCLSIGGVESQITGQFYGAVKHNTCSIINSYYQGTNINGSASTVTLTTQEATLVTDAKLASGEIAFALNGNQSKDVNWFQTLANKVFTATQYTATVNGTPQGTEEANVFLIGEGDSYKFVLPDFVVKYGSVAVPVGDLSFEGVTLKNDGTFEKEGKFDVPDENMAGTAYAALSGYFKNIPYKLNGKVNDDKLYANLTDIAITLGAYGTFNVSIEVGTDDFTAKAPAGDAYPKPYGTAVVYANGSFNCDMTPKEGTTIIFANTDDAIVDPHTFVDGFCSACGAFDATYMTANADGFFEIGTANQLKWFAVYVNQVDPAVNAILTADIDLSSVEWTPIGKGVSYAGTFDGQNFAIANFSYTGSGSYNGLFGQAENATIKNFSISGTLICAGSGNGVIGWTKSSSVSNVHSTLTIDATDGTLHHTAGIVGSANVSTTVDRCSFNGTMTVNASSYDCFGGIVGYTNEYCLIKNCINYGTISFAAANCYAGGIIGYVNSTACYGAHNCLNVGTVEYTGEGDATYSGAIIGRLRGNTPALWGYSYYLEGSAINASGENQITTNIEVTDSQLANGEVAAKLAPYIRQNIGTDATPVLDPTHNVVAEITAAGYATLFVPNADVSVPAGVTAFTGEFESTWLKLNAVIGAIPAQTAVVLKGAAGIYEFGIATPIPDGDLGVYNNEVNGSEALVKGWAAPIEDNVLKGTADDTDAVGKYILANVDGEVCFYKAESGTIRAGKAYLEVPEGTDIKAFYFSFGDDDSTGISTIDKGQLTKDKEIYNLAGQRLQKMQKGINIVGNKKVLY